MRLGTEALTVASVPVSGSVLGSAVYLRSVKAKGNFVFERVSDGEFFIAVLVSWQVGDSPQGSQLMHRVSVRGGITSSVVMAP